MVENRIAQKVGGESKKDSTKLTAQKIYENFRAAFDYKKAFLREAEEDFEFALGKQWDDGDVKDLKALGVRALTINKIRPNIHLLKGLESQNRSDFRAFPEGGEDKIAADITTRLLKNAVKMSGMEYVVSDVFEDGNTCGESWIEPWLDYPYNISPDGEVDINAKLKSRKSDYANVFPEPGKKEYDLSDCEYVCKVTYDVSLDEMIKMFPKKENILRKMKTGGKVDVDSPVESIKLVGDDYEQAREESTGYSWLKKGTFDLIDHYYKKYTEKWFVVDLKAGKVRLAKDETEAKAFVEKATEKDEDKDRNPSARAIKRTVPEIWVAYITGRSNEILEDAPVWSWPRWKGYPLFGYFAYRSTVKLDAKSRDLMTQGIVRRTKDLNRELNKRRTQELRHLNQSANSGWLGEEDSFYDKEKTWDQFGSAPGIILQYAKGKPKPDRISPVPLSQGHAQLAAEHQQDMKESLGINTDLLAVQEGGQSSGRAIALRQKQGLVMVQGLFDNLSRTKKLLGRFILSQLSEIYDVDTAIRVLGDEFIQTNFRKPLVDEQGQPIVDAAGQPQTELDLEAATQTVNKVLTDAEFNSYDVAIGENISSETIQFANFLTLTEMAKNGIPIPPDVLVDESQLSEGTKQKISQSFAAAAGAQA